MGTRADERDRVKLCMCKGRAFGMENGRAFSGRTLEVTEKEESHLQQIK